MTPSSPSTLTSRDVDIDVMLMKRLANADGAAFSLLHARHVHLARRVASFALGSAGREHVDDVVQESFLYVWRRRVVFDPSRGSFPAWLARIVKHRSVDALRRVQAESRRRERLDELGRRALEQEPTLHDPERDERERALRGAIEGLPREQYRVLDLTYYLDVPQSAIAELLGCPLGTVKGRQRLGLARLRAALGDML